jgi:hypothetical protein
VDPVDVRNASHLSLSYLFFKFSDVKGSGFDPFRENVTCKARNDF